MNLICFVIVLTVYFIIAILPSETIGIGQGGIIQTYQSSKLGISFQYPSEWQEPSEDFENCEKENNCSVFFSKLDILPGANPNIYIFSIGAFDLDKPVLSYEPCNCDTLKEYVIWDYNTIWKNKIFINDNQTKIGNNHSAWQMETVNADEKGKVLTVWTINDNVGYKFLYSVQDDTTFDRYLDSFRKMLKGFRVIL